jgi:hypothetical protein
LDEVDLELSGGTLVAQFGEVGVLAIENRADGVRTAQRKRLLRPRGVGQRARRNHCHHGRQADAPCSGTHLDVLPKPAFLLQVST